MNDGDWICPDSNCGNINYARRIVCYRCNKERPDAAKKDFKQKKLGTEIGKSAAEKSRGLFNADDWQCNKCTNVNWARRQTCNVCNAPKFGEVEARTGYGGGYNERGTVEYRRRDHSSDDEYDEFGRKKKKRGSYTPAGEDVGVTAGTVHIKVPPTVLPKEKKMEYGIPQHPQAMKRKENIQSGSLSDGSVCDLAPLTKNNLMVFRKQQFQKPYNVPNRVNKLQDSAQKRKRYISGGDRDLTYSSGYETSSKKICTFNNFSGSNGIERNMCNPVMENRVSSTNDIVCAKNLPIIYTLDERIQIAATAVVYNNCKIVSDKFENYYHKPAPDYKTILLLRQRLLTTGCLIDSHLENRKDTEKSSTTSVECIDVTSKDKKVVKKVLPNPDEIILDSERENDFIQDAVQNNYHLKYSRNSSVETVILGDSPKNISPQKARNIKDGKTGRLKSIESAESDYPDTDSDPEKEDSFKYKKCLSQKSASARNSKRSQTDSESDTPSTGEQTDYFTNYGKPKRKLKRRVTSAKTLNSPKKPVPPVPISVQRYSTVCASDKSPLVTGNIYAPKLNMIPKKPRSYIETDTCSSEYVPTKIGAKTKQNYQQFKDNVIRKGYWAKGDGKALNKCTGYMKSNTTHIAGNNFKKSFPANIIKPVIDSPPKPNTNATNISPNSIEISLPPPKNKNKSRFFDNNTIENCSRIFDIVQTNSSSKNLSITDIFDTNKSSLESPVNENIKMAYDQTRPRIETEWDEEDDALYRNDDDDKFSNKNNSQSLTEIIEPHTPTYQKQSPLKHTTTERDYMKSVKERKNQLFNMLNDFKEGNDINERISLKKHESQNNHNILFHNYQVTESPKNNEVDSKPIPNIVENHNLIINPLHNNTKEGIQCSKNNTLRILSNVQIAPAKYIDTEKQATVDLLPESTPKESLDNIDENNLFEMPSQLMQRPIDIPDDISKLMINMSRNDEVQNTSQDTVASSNLIENKSDESLEINSSKIPEVTLQTTQNLSALLTGIDANALMLALKNIQQFNQDSNKNQNDPTDKGADLPSDKIETINLTNDEEWEKDTDCEETIEQRLEKMDGNTGDTPFLGDIFDPGPVMITPKVAKKLNLPIETPEVNETNLGENESVGVGSFKSFALPKPIMLNRLKLRVPNAQEKNKNCGKKILKKRIKKPKGEGNENEPGDDDESDDNADLSKYELWGSDEEQPKASTAGEATADDGQSSKEVNNEKENDKNGESDEGRGKNRKRSRSSSSSTSSSSSSSSSPSSEEATNKFDDFNLNSERESPGRADRHPRKSRSRSPRPKPAAIARRKSRDSRSGGDSRGSEQQRERQRRPGGERREHRYSRDGSNYYPRGKHR